MYCLINIWKKIFRELTQLEKFNVSKFLYKNLLDKTTFAHTVYTQFVYQWRINNFAMAERNTSSKGCVLEILLPE